MNHLEAKEAHRMAKDLMHFVKRFFCSTINDIQTTHQKEDTNAWSTMKTGHN